MATTTTIVASVPEVPTVRAAHERLMNARKAHDQAAAERQRLWRVLEPPPDAPRAQPIDVMEARLGWVEAERRALQAQIDFEAAQRAYEVARTEARRTLGPPLHARTVELLRRLDRALRAAATINEELQRFEEAAHQQMDHTNLARQVLAWPYFTLERVAEWRRILAREGYVLEED